MITTLLNRASSLIAGRLCQHRGKPIPDKIERGVDAFHRILNNVNFMMETNGELRVLQILSEFHPQCVFDVGANKGEWSQLLSKMNPPCVIHAFEIVPATYEHLVRNTRELQNVIPNNFGLSIEDEIISISMGPDSATATGCKIDGMQFHEQYYSQVIQCRARKASDYIIEKNIGSIDFVKVDVEGMDLRVIKGFGDLLKQVRAVQFEYGIFNIASHDLLSDFCRHFKDQGFLVGKIFPRHVSFFEYHFNMENFHGSNYLAVRKSETALIESLGGFGAYNP